MLEVIVMCIVYLSVFVFNTPIRGSNKPLSSEQINKKCILKILVPMRSVILAYKSSVIVSLLYLIFNIYIAVNIIFFLT